MAVTEGLGCWRVLFIVRSGKSPFSEEWESRRRGGGRMVGGGVGAPGAGNGEKLPGARGCERDMLSIGGEESEVT